IALEYSPHYVYARLSTQFVIFSCINELTHIHFIYFMERIANRVFTKACVDDSDHCSHQAYVPGTVMDIDAAMMNVLIDGEVSSVLRHRNHVFRMPEDHSCFQKS